MKIKIIIAIMCLAFLACTTNDLSVVPVEGVLNKPAVGREDQSVVFKVSQDQNLNILVQKIEEARCPSDVQCISAGYVKVIFQISDVADIELITPTFAGSNADEKSEFTYNKHHYRITLKNVTPYPSTVNYEETKSVEFLLELI